MNGYRYAQGYPAPAAGNPYSALLGSVGCMPRAATVISPALAARTTPPAPATVGQVEPGFNAFNPWVALTMASAAASAYHGYARNRSILWAGIWGIAGGVFPIITPAIALAQGFGERE